ncbi:MAG: 4Fe-4S binding protein [Candidatus Latescibacter sp.]|nr:4Fe-4S binding protein [Candidatus Latescibacter sp.]
MIVIERKRCEVCGTCVGVCPADAIIIEGPDICIDMERCISCQACVQVCPVGAVIPSGFAISPY